ncbi:phage tail assembly chaperone [Pseudomonas sp. S9]|uniref:phage tail assembly chaperone n=1 Tax=Pseudomonas sp. S9 TaxID=686578 RepID=UPI0002556F54|nr:phage tail assembly chaperone [Pseudomonas sp. S9]
MTKFKLDADPTFEATVDIPVPGGKSAPVKFTFKHRTKDELAEMFGPKSKLSNAETVLKIVAGWDLDDELNEASINKLEQNYQASINAIVNKYVAEIGPARLGN